MIRLRELALRPGSDETELRRLAAKALGVKPDDIRHLNIYRKSIDARQKSDVRIVYTVDLELAVDEKRPLQRAGQRAAIVKSRPYTPPAPLNALPQRPLVVGFGPAGIFAALLLAMAGLRPLVIERGADVDTRQQKVERFWSSGELDPQCNVQFGEGGAGTFSDGKLNTGIKDRRIGWILQQLHQAGADSSILTDARPHIGTDALRRVVRSLREKIIALGGELRFNTALTEIQLEQGSLTGVTLSDGERLDCSRLILAIGHSARDTFAMLQRQGVPMIAKAFSLGVRIEHRQQDIDRAQYGAFAGHADLPPADYRLSCHFAEGDSAYTFCMCPGGYVVAAASESGGVVTNGMSEFARNGANANAALLVTVTPEQFPGSGPLAGMHWQRQIEQRCFAVGGGNYFAPAQLVGDFLAHRASQGAAGVEPTYRPGVSWCDLHQALPPQITTTLEKALPALGRKLHGFDAASAVLTAPETRSSSPVRICRDEKCQSAVTGLFPCGEGAGYAGGIISAAVDGMRCAEALIDSLR